MKNGIQVILTFIVVVTGIFAQENQLPPIDWKLIKECSAEFSLPADFKEQVVTGIDSCVRDYRGKSSFLALDVVDYSSPSASRKREYANERDVKYEKTKIGGRDAEIITYYPNRRELQAQAEGKKEFRYAALLFVPQMQNDGGSLTIWTYSKTPQARETALKIFQTVRFPKD